jgi:hypothetical protein
MGRLVMAGFQ